MGGKHAHPYEREWYWIHNDFFELWKSLDWPAVRRGRQVYTEVFAPCHSLTNLTFNNFQQFMTKEEIKQLAANYEIVDPDPDNTGNHQTRAGKPTDDLPAPYPNSKAAAFANGGAAPPDLRTMVWAREGHEDYLFSLLTGYDWKDYMPIPPFAPQLKAGQFWNPFMKGCVIAMPPPLSDGQIEYYDGTPATVSQMAKDVTAFLRWSVQPNQDDNRLIAWKVIVSMGAFLLISTHWVQKAQTWRNYGRWTWRAWKNTMDRY
jgi:ubiquinol-cytochrome c reductase cytochrome c1 subunit